MKDLEIKCRKCGRRIAIISRGLYRNVLVDPEELMIVATEQGEEFIRIDGSKVRGRELEDIYWQTGEKPKNQPEPAYRQHRKTCGAGK